MQNLSRRSFLYTTGAATAGLSLGSPFGRTGTPRLRLALAAYSFRQFFPFQKTSKREVKERPMDMAKFIDFCAAHGCTGTELTSYFFPRPLPRAHLVGLRRRAFLSSVEISGTAVGNNFSLPQGPARDAQVAYVKQWIDHAAVLGAPHVRVFAGRAPKGVSRDEADRWAIAALRECCDHAAKHGIFLGIENHDSIGDAKSLLRFVKAVDHEWFGVNLDSGNFRTNDPYVDFAAAAPFAVNVQVKVEMRVGGQTQPTDFKRIAALLRQAKYQGYVTLEYEAREDPYTAVPPLLKQLGALMG